MGHMLGRIRSNCLLFYAECHGGPPRQLALGEAEEWSWARLRSPIASAWKMPRGRAKGCDRQRVVIQVCKSYVEPDTQPAIDRLDLYGP